MSNSKKHFHTFDAFRFFSFLLVFLHHVPIPESSFMHFFANSGGIGVGFFFVLSGFLITYILLNEKLAEQRISLKNFFIRRILRIWPLFYAMILFAFLTPYILEFFHFSSSEKGYNPNWLVSMSFLENYKMMFTNDFPNISPLRVMWSLCVEEHFYVIWGILFFFLPLKKIPYLIGFSILIANITRIIYYKFDIETLDVFSNIDYFALGAIPAYIFLVRAEILNKISQISTTLKQLFLLSTLIILFILSNIQLGIFSILIPTILGALFSIMILFTLSNTNSIQISDNFLFSRLGKYTYGLYLYHVIIINLLLQTIHFLPFEISWFAFVTISLLLTIIISLLSYHLFEKQFLKLKKYFY